MEEKKILSDESIYLLSEAFILSDFYGEYYPSHNDGMFPKPELAYQLMKDGIYFSKGEKYDNICDMEDCIRQAYADAQLIAYRGFPTEKEIKEKIQIVEELAKGYNLQHILEEVKKDHGPISPLRDDIKKNFDYYKKALDANSIGP